MRLSREFRRRVRHTLGPTLSAALVFYFAYHAVEGERGLVAWWHLRHQIEAARLQAAQTAIERRVWERRVSLMRPGSLDRDMIDERARLMLDLAGPDEVVIFDPRR